MTGLPYAFKANFHDPNVPSCHPSDALTLSAGCLSPSLIDPFPDFDVIEEWILEPELSGMPTGGNPSEHLENLNSGSPISSSGVNCIPAGESASGVVGNSYCESTVSSFIGERPSAEKRLSDSGVGEGGRAAALKAEVVDGFLRKMKIEDDNEFGRGGEVAVRLREIVVEEDDGGGAFGSVGGDWEKGGASAGSVSAGGNEEKDAIVSEDLSSSSSSSSGSSNSSEEEEEEKDDADNDDDDEEEEEEETGPASSSGSSSSSSLEDEDSDNAEVEEGEIRDLKSKKSGEMFADSDIDEEEEMMKGPIKSKNELDPENLPPVPSIDVALEPQHGTLPVGVVLSIMDNKVVVEGSEKHNPLTEGSILWITEKRLPLGLVDEIFGPVKNPYYVVRYNTDKEVPPGVQEGTAVSFVPEFADHVLNNKDIYKKGYDASGENDEEIVDELEFSDDEKEAEYRKSQQRKAKRTTNDKKVKQLESIDRKKVQNRGGFSNRNRSSDSAGVKSLPPLSLSAVAPLIPSHEPMHPSSGQFVNGISLHSACQPPFPSIAPPVCPPQVVNSQQMPSVSIPAVCSPHIPNGQQIPNLPSNHFGLVGGSFTPLLGPLTCGTMANTFNAHGLPVPRTHGVQQPSYPVSSLQNFQQQPPSAWTTMPSCQQQPQQQPVFFGVQNSPWRCETAGQQLPGLLGNPLQGLQNFASPGAFPQQSVPQAPGCMNWQGFMNQPNLNGVAFPGGNMHGNPNANAVQQWNPMGGFNAPEQTAQFNPNQCFGQFVPGTANNLSTPEQYNQMNTPDNRRRQPAKGGNFHRRKGPWHRPRQ
ncbi:H/ACA ribonucleoprotein complex non-core subunit NAF1 [Nymphaea colorata]|nr:H/ACA ribonucleoprotein complex non-core subunit NAF1 [Nymphaea colorata]